MNIFANGVRRKNRLQQAAAALANRRFVAAAASKKADGLSLEERYHKLFYQKEQAVRQNVALKRELARYRRERMAETLQSTVVSQNFIKETVQEFVKATNEDFLAIMDFIMERHDSMLTRVRQLEETIFNETSDSPRSRKSTQCSLDTTERQSRRLAAFERAKNYFHALSELSTIDESRFRSSTIHSLWKEVRKSFLCVSPIPSQDEEDERGSTCALPQKHNPHSVHNKPRDPHFIRQSKAYDGQQLNESQHISGIHLSEISQAETEESAVESVARLSITAPHQKDSTLHVENEIDIQSLRRSTRISERNQSLESTELGGIAFTSGIFSASGTSRFRSSLEPLLDTFMDETSAPMSINSSSVLASATNSDSCEVSRNISGVLDETAIEPKTPEVEKLRKAETNPTGSEMHSLQVRTPDFEESPQPKTIHKPKKRQKKVASKKRNAPVSRDQSRSPERHAHDLGQNSNASNTRGTVKSSSSSSTMSDNKLTKKKRKQLTEEERLLSEQRKSRLRPRMKQTLQEES